MRQTIRRAIGIRRGWDCDRARQRQSREAEIHYSGVLNLKFNDFSESDHLALDNGASLFFWHVEDLSGYDLFDFFAVLNGAVSNQVGGRGQKASSLHPGVDRLYFGQRVSNVQFIGLTSGNPVLISRMSRDSPWRRPGEGFVAFKFDTGGGTQYGWARIIMGRFPSRPFTVVDYAWSDPGESIVAGQTSTMKSESDTVPQSGSLGLLALGGAGVIAWRKGQAEPASR